MQEGFVTETVTLRALTDVPTVAPWTSVPILPTASPASDDDAAWVGAVVALFVSVLLLVVCVVVVCCFFTKSDTVSFSIAGDHLLADVEQKQQEFTLYYDQEAQAALASGTQSPTKSDPLPLCFSSLDSEMDPPPTSLPLTDRTEASAFVQEGRR